MFLEIFSPYIEGLLLAIVFVFLVGIIWNFWRAARKLGKTTKKRQAFLYDMSMVSIITISALSFAFMAILLMFKAQ